MTKYLPGTFQWDRAHTFLQQCAQPFRHDIEPAMLWRLLPPLVCHALGLRGWAALALPWLGVIAVTVFVAGLLARRLADARFVFGGTLLFATTSAILVPVGWLGMNDAWVWLGLLAFAFCDSWAARLASCLLCPWIDERFLIGLPLALAVRVADRGHEEFRFRSLWPTLGVIVYCATRFILGRADPALAGASTSFLAGQIRETGVLIPLAPLAWWMGLRAAWLPAFFAIRKHPWLLGGSAALTLGVMLLLASDTSRNTAMLTPLVLLGVFRFAQQYPALATRAALYLGAANLLIPAAHLTYNKIDPISTLSVELWRVLR